MSTYFFFIVPTIISYTSEISIYTAFSFFFIPFLDRLEKNSNKKYDPVAADAGCESEENYDYLESKKQEAFIKPSTYEKSKTKKKSKSGYQAIVSIYECEKCHGCKYKDRCTKAKGNKQIYVAKNFVNLRKKSLEDITTPNGILLRINR